MIKGYCPPHCDYRDLLSGELLCNSFDMTGVGQEDFDALSDFAWE